LKIVYRQLGNQLQAGLEAVYLVAGEEPLLVAEALDQVREAARTQGFEERELHVVDRSYRWPELGTRSDNLSLFAARKILELRMSSPRPGDAGSKALRALAENPQADRLVLIGIMAKLDASVARSAWVKSIEKFGVRVDIWPIARAELPQWVRGRARKSGLEFTSDAAELLADRVEGNLLAADQEIRKLAMTQSAATITEDDVIAAVASNARFDVFGLTDAVLAGDSVRALRILAGLRAEGVQPTLVGWALTRELTLLARLAEVGRGLDDKLMLRYGVWQRRQPLVRAALRRFTVTQLAILLDRAALTDEIVKGARFGRPWESITALVMASLDPGRLAA
jgi:DNA polymerase-3 subunit delta